MSRKTISISQAPAAIGPYSQAIRAGDFLFISGQIPIDPDTNAMVEGDIEIQTKRVLDNLLAILHSEGLTAANVIKTTIFLDKMDHFSIVNELYGRVFTSAPPARETIQASALPKKALIEISAVAYYCA